MTSVLSSLWFQSAGPTTGTCGGVSSSSKTSGSSPPTPTCNFTWEKSRTPSPGPTTRPESSSSGPRTRPTLGRGDYVITLGYGYYGSRSTPPGSPPVETNTREDSSSSDRTDTHLVCGDSVRHSHGPHRPRFVSKTRFRLESQTVGNVGENFSSRRGTHHLGIRNPF